MTQHLVVETQAGHMPPLGRKAVFPVRQAYVCAKSCSYMAVYFIVVCCLYWRTSGTVTVQI